jgi:class 3 adenylate cyclase
MVLALHLGCFFVRARIAYPLISAAAFFAAGVGIMVFFVGAAGDPAVGRDAVVGELAERTPRQEVRRAIVGGISVSVVLSIAVFILSLVWAGVGIFTAVLGGWSLVRREETAVHRLSRQELLARLFDRQSRLADLAAEGRLVRRRTIIAWTSGPYGFWGLSAIIGFVSGLVFAAATGWMRSLAVEERIFWQAMAGITTWALMSLGLVVAGILGRQARRPGKAALGATIALGAAIFALAIPFPTFGPEFVRDLAGSRILVIYLIASAGVAALVGMAGEVEGRAQTLRGLKGDDPALLLADIIRIQRRLAPRSQGVCVAVVDVVRSTRMKLNAPPLDIEFSFREYQNLAAAAAAAQGGEVISTAGDGAVLAFPSAEQAYRGARAILKDLARFNREVNRLSTEFRVRIGLHCGETAADLGEAPYNELIDIAAHVESKAPSNGIALTQAVASELPGEALAEIAEPVDGQRIFFALYPLSES